MTVPKRLKNGLSWLGIASCESRYLHVDQLIIGAVARYLRRDISVDYTIIQYRELLTTLTRVLTRFCLVGLSTVRRRLL